MPKGPKILFAISELKTHNVLVRSIDCGFRYNYFGKISLFSFLSRCSWKIISPH